MKKFIITVDTEGDNLWNWNPGQPITTNNAKFIPRFQELCENYSFYPVYLTNLEMVQSKEFQKYIGKKAQEGKCEIGMHLHAWNTPPIVEKKQRYGGLPYITEYSEQIIYEKHHYLKTEIEKSLDVSPKTYRAGRWATNNELFKVLDNLGFIADCSVTPGISWENCPGSTVDGGNDYRSFLNKAYCLTDTMVEVPLTSKKVHCPYGKTLKSIVKNILIGVEGNLRPATSSLELMMRLTRKIEGEKNDYLEFMLHSSELMPGGSPYFRNENDIEEMYKGMEAYFKWIAGKDYEGIMLKDYAQLFLNQRRRQE